MTKTLLSVERLGSRTWLIVILALYLGMALLYGVTTPIFESPDEFQHFFVVEHIAQTGSLPVQHADSGAERIAHTDSLYQQQANQPPLYYTLAALLISPIDISDARELAWVNPHRNIGNPFKPGNKNYIIHTEYENWPWRNTVLAIHVIRVFSALLGLVGVWLAYRLARRVVDEPAVAWVAAGLVAFNPMYLFIHGSVNNDTLISALGAGTIYFLVLIAQEGATRRRLLLLGGLLSAAALTKLSGLSLFVPAAVVCWWRWRQGDGQRLLARWAVVPALPAFLAGWWYARNWLHYGNPLGLNAMLETIGLRENPPGLLGLLGEFLGFWYSYWAVFGWFSVPFPEPIYLVYNLMALGAFVGLGVRIYRRQWPLSSIFTSVCVAWFAVLFVLLLYWARLQGIQGRLLFLAAPTVALLIALGWRTLLPGVLYWVFSVPFLMGGLIVAVLTPFLIIRPAYQPPVQIAPEQLPLAVVDARDFGDQVRLWGVEVHSDTVAPGSSLEVTFYWEALRSMDEDYTLYVGALGRERNVVARIHTYPGWGTLPTSLWAPGRIIKDRYRLQIPEDAEAPSGLWIEISFFDHETGESLSPRATDGAPMDGLVARLRLAHSNHELPEPQHSVDFVIADAVRLYGYDASPAPLLHPGDVLELALYWRALAPLHRDYTVFVHLLDRDNNRVAGFDQMPLAGDFPTSLWRPGDALRDPVQLEIPDRLPTGPYRLLVGMYSLGDMQRLPISAGPVERIHANGVVLGAVQIQD